MQLMPFNVEAIAKELNPRARVSWLFRIDVLSCELMSLMQNILTCPLIKEFRHPLFVLCL